MTYEYRPKFEHGTEIWPVAGVVGAIEHRAIRTAGLPASCFGAAVHLGLSILINPGVWAPGMEDTEGYNVQGHNDRGNRKNDE